MAKQPNVIPFQEGAPPDNLEVEEIENNEVLIGDKSLDDIVEITDEHDSNIAEEIDEHSLHNATIYINYVFYASK